MSKPGLVATVRAFPRTFWIANTMEIFERMAWYGWFAVAPLYVTGRIDEGALGWSARDSGLVLGVVTFLLYLMPVVTGALADRYGYKRMFIIAFSVLTPSYYLLGQFSSFGGFFAIFLLVALGAAIFKPVVVGTVARCTTDQSASLGFGIFYMMVNVGGFVGPIVAGIVRAYDWQYVFVASACWIAVNFLWVLVFYKEPTTESASASRRTLGRVLGDMVTVLGNGRFFLTVFSVVVLFLAAGKEWISWWPTTALAAVGWVAANLLYDVALRVLERRGRPAEVWCLRPMRAGDWRFGLYLLLLSGFWACFNQLFLTMPLYIENFVDTTTILSSFGNAAGALGLSSVEAYFQGLVRNGYEINPEYLVNLDAGAIVLFQVLVSWFAGRFRPLPTMVVGTLVMAGGLAIAALGGSAAGASGWIAVLAIFVFAIGEMTASPKSQEYVGRIAPPEKTALYMGYYFVSVALGNLFGGLLSGETYASLAEGKGRPDLMWLVLAGVGVVSAGALLAYDRWVLPRPAAAEPPEPDAAGV